MPTLKKTINHSLMYLMLVSITVMLAAIVFLQIAAEHRRVYDVAMRDFAQIEQVLEENDREIAAVKRAYRQTCLNNAAVIARIIEGNPSIIHSVAELKELASITGVDEIHIFDSTGRIFAGTHPQYYDYTFDSSEQMAFFKPLLEDKSLQLVQDITPNTAEAKLMQYSALWSRNEGFIVQVGMEPVNVMQTTQKNELSYIFSLFCVGEADYYAIQPETGEIVGATVAESVGKMPEEIGLSLPDIQNAPDSFFAQVNGQRCYCVFKLVGNNYLGRVVSTSSLYQRIPLTVFEIASGLSLIVLILWYAITSCMDKFVVKKIQAVNETLHSITMGNYDETVNIHSTAEFSELSQYLNSMIARLLDSNKKMSHVLRKTHTHIGIYEYSPPAEKVRFTDYLPQLFCLSHDELDRLASDPERFKAFVDAIHQNPVPDEPDTFQLPGQPDHYLQMEEACESSSTLGIVTEVTDVILQRRKMQQERDTDPLTGLYNRFGLDRELSLLFQEPEKLGHSALVVIDADGLKATNDAYGHQKGDVYLQRISETIRGFGPKCSLAARQGGDEFVLFLYRYDSEAELLEALRSLEKLQDQRSVHLDDTICVSVRFSLGYCLTAPGMDYPALIREADQQMYQNKRQRKGCSCQPLPPPLKNPHSNKKQPL